MDRNNVAGIIDFPFARLEESALMDRNNVNGSMQPICNGNNIALVSADCEEVRCECCNLCCAEGQECHDFNLVSTFDLRWKNSFDRQFFQFSNDTSGVFYLILATPTATEVDISRMGG